MPVFRVQTDREVEAIARGLVRQFAIAVAFLVVVVIVSTLGLLAFQPYPESTLPTRVGLALWDTLNLVSTVGSLEERFTPGQRVWAMLVIVFGLGAVLYGFSTLQGLLHGGEVRRHFARRRMKRTLEGIADHIVLCGYGHVGREVAHRIVAADRDLVVIERAEAAVAKASADGHLVVQADAADEPALREAGVERAAGLIVSLDTDAANVYVILLARELNPDLRIVSRAERSISRRTLRRAGADRVIVPGEIAGHQLSHLILKPQVSEFLAAAVGEGAYEFQEVEVDRYPALAGRMLSELDLPSRAEMIVIAVIDAAGAQHFNPPAERRLDRGETLLTVVHERGRQGLEAVIASIA